jgi:DNA-binding SARP family transcriptional activator
MNDAPVTKVPSGRGGMILKYLVYHHRRNLPRDQLMELLWPEAEPDMARNRLNVALSGLRRELRRFIRNEVIVFDDGKYGLDPSWTVWVDVEEFERSLEAARHSESAGNMEQGIQHLEVAANLYQGDFLAEDPYEEWTISIRERLRLAYLDALYLLGRRYFELGQYGACAALCQLILERDRCREDVHCLLMRCYAGQEQIPLALRQYQVCVEALQRELDVTPEPATTQLAERLRRHEGISPSFL